MRTFGAALACASAILLIAGSASASLIVGVNDDAPKDAGVAPWFYSTMSSERLGLNALTLRWDDGAPTDIPGQAAIEQAISKASATGISVELDLYPLHSQVFTGGGKCSPSSDPESCGDTSLIQQFASWVGSVARAFPSVHQFVVMNECNQPLFLNPQWDSSGQNQSAEICGRALAAAYDALKSVSVANFVWGVGLSPRGNDAVNAASNSSTSPVKFLGALGKWFAAFAQKTHRTAPLMDGLDDHPYPVPQTLPFAQGYSDPNSASVSNLPRIYQAFYDAFKGTPQKTIGQQAGGGLRVSLNETGIQTDSSAKGAVYSGVEVSATAAGGVTGAFATESYQANWYLQMLNLVACDPNVQVVNIFHLIDESNLAGWQSGLYYADQTPKQSASTVQGWIAQTNGNCQGKQTPWTPTGLTATTTTTTTAKVKTKATGKAKKVVHGKTTPKGKGKTGGKSAPKGSSKGKSTTITTATTTGKSTGKGKGKGKSTTITTTPQTTTTGNGKSTGKGKSTTITTTPQATTTSQTTTTAQTTTTTTGKSTGKGKTK